MQKYTIIPLFNDFSDIKIAKKHIFQENECFIDKKYVTLLPVKYNKEDSKPKKWDNYRKDTRIIVSLKST